MAPQNSHPPSLPPTVEEAYRRKCIQLKERSKEIEDENDAYRLRLARLKRQIQKLRLERAIILDAIAKRTSTNVEDSEGSPSPPPTPQDKPLRTKRGHQSQKDQGRAGNGAPKPPKRPSNSFEIYCNDTRPLLQTEHKDAIAAGTFRLEEELAKGWKVLPETEKDQFQARYERELSQWKEARESFKQGMKEAAARERSRARENRTSRGGRSRFEEIHDDEDADDDQDIEMGDADPDQVGDQDTDPETEVEDNEGAD
ncbi:hypothetical protein F4808DRAFT_471393 [Astrocystis sublimbata]|nr:hypothetical protein F4808DRAFT_471393 [Astrocystis sublimbata]